MASPPSPLRRVLSTLEEATGLGALARRAANVPSPLRWRATTGTALWQGNLQSKRRIWASPTAGDGKIYCIDETGQVTIAAAGDAFKVLSRVELGGSPVKSSIAISNGKLFIRTADKLYCMGS